MNRMRAIAALLRDESGQALTEQGILLTTLLGIGAVGGLWLVKAHPEMLKALDIAMRSYLFVLSLPFP
jgi:Flp pilus assembly pilin Flp